LPIAFQRRLQIDNGLASSPCFSVSTMLLGFFERDPPALRFVHKRL
jgi:hypothetical protein